MPTPNERKGLWFLALVALSGTGVRVWRARMPPPSGVEARAMEQQLAKIDSARSARAKSRTGPRATRSRARDTVARPDRDATPDELIELNGADAATIEKLPGIGPAMAKRIVAHRDSLGPFSGMAAFCDVRGIGPAIAERLRPLVTFGGQHSPVSDACAPASKGAGKSRAARGRERP